MFPCNVIIAILAVCYFYKYMLKLSPPSFKTELHFIVLKSNIYHSLNSLTVLNTMTLENASAFLILSIPAHYIIL